jgi:hypothetical protein
MAKARGESKTGLITSLVLFILATLGLGVYAYTLQADVDAKDKAAKEATTAKGNLEKDRDWYKFQAQYYRQCMGNLDPKDNEAVAVKWASFDSGALAGNATDKDEVTRLIKENLTKIKDMEFDPTTKRPRKSFLDLLHDKDARIQALQNQNGATDGRLKDTEKKLKDAEDAKAAATANYQAELEKAAKQHQAEMSGLVKSNEDLRGQVRQINDSMNKEKEKFTVDTAKTKKDSDKKDKEMAKLRTRLDEKEQEIAQVKQKSGDAPKDWRTDWKIVNMDRTGSQPYINLGSADNVTPQLTFNVHGVGPDGKPLPRSKGTIEVVNVISDHLSQVRITSWKDRDKDPIVKGDVLFNPVWDPTYKKHVALAGTLDVTGEGRGSHIAEFIRHLEKRNIVVDAYLDLKEKTPTIKGPGISIQTDYLILGYGPSGDAREVDKQFQEDFRNRYEEMKKQAKENGVTIINLRDYLDRIGFRLPRAFAEKNAATQVPSILETAPPGGGDKKEPEKDKPMDKQ